MYYLQNAKAQERALNVEISVLSISRFRQNGNWVVEEKRLKNKKRHQNDDVL